MTYSSRIIRYERCCDSVIDRVVAEHGDMAITGLEWSLSHKPGEWFQVPGTDLYVAKATNPAIRMFFKFDDSVVSVLAVDAD